VSSEHAAMAYRGRDRRKHGVHDLADYRGPDRRNRSPFAAESHPLWYLGVSIAALLLCVIAVIAIGSGKTGLAVTFIALRDTGAGMLVLAGTILLVLWALTGRATRVFDGSALLLAGGGMLVLAGPWSALMHHNRDAVLLSPGARLVVGVPALVLLVAGGWMTPVNSAIKPRRVLALSATAALGVLVLEGTLRIWGPIDQQSVLVWITSFLAVAWVAAGISRLVSTTRRPVPSRRLLGLSLVAFGVGDLFFVIGLLSDFRWAVVGAAIQLVGAAGATRMAVSALTGVLAQYSRLRLRLAAELTDVTTVLADEQSIRRGLLHDARNVVAAIRAATVTLERHSDRLDPALQAQLRQTVGSEFGKLQHLLESRSRERAS
jgi:hypothetical protein